MNRKKENIIPKETQVVDLKFVDFFGALQHVTVPIREFNDDTIQKGFGFDGSSIRGWQHINESDMILVPDMKTLKRDPFYSDTATVLCYVRDPVEKKWYSRDPRFVVTKATAYLKQTGIGDVAYFGPELEFFIFDNVKFYQYQNAAGYEIDSSEGIWNSGKNGNGYAIRNKEGYVPVSPQDSLQNIRTEMILILEQLGIKIEKHHHEVATAGQTEIDMHYLPLLQMSDAVMWYKYVAKNVSKRNGKTTTFMPKPIFGDNGSGMHTHQSIWKKGEPLFAGKKYGALSELALYYIGGILDHAPALSALIAPTVNSYKRLVPGFEAPVNLVYSFRNRSAAIRIPMYEPGNPVATRIEVRCPDPSCNPYFAFSAMLMAGLDGIENQMDPGKPFEGDVYEYKGKLSHLPTSLNEATEALKKDHTFLMKGGVFTGDIIKILIEKEEEEWREYSTRPTPYEFQKYFDR